MGAGLLMVRKILGAGFGAFGLVLIAVPAHADAIDGDWCHTPDNRRFSIRGPDIVTPGGMQMQGEYSRHYFTYIVPAPEPHAGATVYMQLLDENTIHLRVGDASGADPEMWIRCSPSISARPHRPFT
jgi:hypothetical protein